MAEKTKLASLDLDSVLKASVNNQSDLDEGIIVRIVGPVVDVKFEDHMPAIYTALKVDAETPFGHIKTELEVESQLPGGIVRTVCMWWIPASPCRCL